MSSRFECIPHFVCTVRPKWMGIISSNKSRNTGGCCGVCDAGSSLVNSKFALLYHCFCMFPFLLFSFSFFSSFSSFSSFFWHSLTDLTLTCIQVRRTQKISGGVPRSTTAATTWQKTCYSRWCRQPKKQDSHRRHAQRRLIW